jgi:hypothetical protein
VGGAILLVKFYHLGERKAHSYAVNVITLGLLIGGTLFCGGLCRMLDANFVEYAFPAAWEVRHGGRLRLGCPNPSGAL